MEYAWQNNRSRVIIETDSELATKWIERVEITNPFAHNLVRMCWQSMDQDWDIVFLHSYREGNKAADFLAKLACTHRQGMIIYAQPPPNMEQILQ